MKCIYTRRLGYLCMLIGLSLHGRSRGRGWCAALLDSVYLRFKVSFLSTPAYPLAFETPELATRSTPDMAKRSIKY